MVRSNLRLLVFPVTDSALRDEVHEAVARVSDELPNDIARLQVERDLRRWYRSLQIRERDDLGGYPDDPIRVWYVYRDGRVRRQNPVRDRLYDALATARTTRITSEGAIDSARRTATEAGFDVAGHSIADRDPAKEPPAS
jgi:hypothetical protein